jgi:class 3 adenylate cyclase/tetratricopeptide (TPR) repeat protein
MDGGAASQPERRLVSVLFADLVGFTTLSESRDSEEVRELLSMYFAACRARITRYGGTVEKFIGDAVMAVWGAPVANEDDAERAVRAALEVVEAVRDLGVELGAPGLAARAGVLTGEAAVNLAATAEGLVAGDLVNSASRVQSLASPGTVLVDDATRRATNAAIAYTEGGTHELRGKSVPMTLWRPLRVVAGRGGAHKSAGLESPFVGRSRELALIKDLLHDSADKGVAHLTSVSGIAGIGKSRLTWELFKYIDGLSDTIWWHRGRCLAYGEGVTYWALAEMIRARVGIAEDEGPATAMDKLRAAVAEHVPTDDEREWVLPRLASLLGLDDQSSADAADLFSGWRLFFERMSQRHPVVLVFEDLHWADSALLDFIDYLLDWSRNHPIYVLTLARPELDERRGGFGAGRRNVTSLSLEPLLDDAMDELLDGLVPGLPAGVRDRVRDRAEGVPLYAVETVRMLVDKGALQREGDRYVPVSPIDDLDVPETLQALIAARLDGLSSIERTLLQTASVLGKTFTDGALANVSGLSEAEIAPVLSGLVRKELLSVQADVRSPERAEYGFLQSLVQKVAQDTLSRRERRALHLAAAAYLRQNWATDEGEVVQVIASHYLDAYLVDTNAPDADEIRQEARDFLTRAGERAAAIAAQEEAERYYGRAAELADDDGVRAELLLRSAMAANSAGRSELHRLFEESIELFRRVGDDMGAGRAMKEFAIARWAARGEVEEALELLDESRRTLTATGPAALRAEIAQARGRMLFFLGRSSEALETLDEALELAEGERLLATLSDAMNTKALLLQSHGRTEEALSLLDGALRIGLESGHAITTARAYTNLSYSASEKDNLEAGLAWAQQGLALARKVGHRNYEWFLMGHVCSYLTWLGRWDEAERELDAMPGPTEISEARGAGLIATGIRVLMAGARGDVEACGRLVELFDTVLESADVQDRGTALVYEALAAHGRGDFAAAQTFGQRALAECIPIMGIRHPVLRLGLTVLMDSSLHLGDIGIVEKTLEDIESRPVGHLSPYLLADVARFRARLLVAAGLDDGVEDLYRTAERILEPPGLRYQLAVVRGELAEWLFARERYADATAVATVARDTFEDLRAEPWMRRLEPVLQPLQTPATA